MLGIVDDNDGDVVREVAAEDSRNSVGHDRRSKAERCVVLVV